MVRWHDLSLPVPTEEKECKIALGSLCERVKQRRTASRTAQQTTTKTAYRNKGTIDHSQGRTRARRAVEQTYTVIAFPATHTIQCTGFDPQPTSLSTVSDKAE